MKRPRIRWEQWKWLLFCGVPYLGAGLLGMLADLAGCDWLADECQGYLDELRRIQ